MARGGWLSRFVPIGFVMVYAPRNADELEAVMGIIQAAIWWVGGQTLVKPGVEDPRRTVAAVATLTCFTGTEIEVKGAENIAA